MGEGELFTRFKEGEILVVVVVAPLLNVGGGGEPLLGITILDNLWLIDIAVRILGEIPLTAGTIFGD
jgi:DUF917 family protein